MGKVISFINSKIGVGKTTTTVALAEFLTYEFNKKVLVIDLDPQTNATILLIKQATWKRANENNKTIHQMFLDELNNTKAFNIEDSILKRTSNIDSDTNNLHLLPSSLNLINIGDKLSELEKNHELNKYSIPILSKHLNKGIIARYDYVLIDCPPNLDLITLNGLYISNYYVIPVLPDILSTYAIPEMLNKIELSKKKIKLLNPVYTLYELGLIVNKMIKNNGMHKRTLNNLQNRQTKPREDLNYVPKLFESIIYQEDSFPNMSDFDQSFSTIEKKYGTNYNDYRNLAIEFISRTN
ncbi:AAA family ATPase [Clostridium sp. PL3]|uniref:AAA family ATPase n=1 Tax=Clostridium thailandense TaxID=2794346 RepID=A0A949TVQ7_9CLOT|nr:AAA family ATPase [Clostridium thailandense]MBV7272731.1 AAA family ATPase [Clostridium thailandense]